MLRWLCLGIPIWLLTAGLCLATCPAPVVVRSHRQSPIVHHAAPVVVQKQIVEKLIPVAVYQPLAALVPAYTAGYIPPAAAPAPAPTPTSPPAAPAQPGLAEVLAELKRLNGRLDALEKGQPAPAPTPSPAPKPVDPFNPGAGAAANTIRPAAAVTAGGAHLAVFASKCVACHQRGKEDDGGGFVLTEPNGSVVTLSERERLAMYRHIDKGSMPPRNNKKGLEPLTQDEAGAVLDWLASLK